MQNNVLNVSENFRRMAVKSVLSIILFFFTYVFLVIMGIGVIFLCGFIAYHLVAFSVSFVTAMLALGCLGMGFLIFFFLIKFIFSGTKQVDRSHLIEITEQDQPELFHMIDALVIEVKTSFPKKVYLSSEVNAAVFYDSNFWSMFFPVRKNLMIGMGLMNTVSVVELKAILAHEFGHFSQRSMKVGSYVYNVNKVIYNMLYENEGYQSVLNSWSNISNYFALFAKGAILFIGGIQYVLHKVYNILYLNYMALSREMEFHADAVAASVAGSEPMVNSLLRMELASHSLEVVFNYYNSKIVASQKPANVYPQQYFVLNHIAVSEKFPIQNGLPLLSLAGYGTFKKTKLVLDDQWSSHPSTEQRISKLTELNQPVKDGNHAIAINLLIDQELVQKQITARLLLNVEYETEPVMLDFSEFIKEFLQVEKEHSYPAIFKNYYDERDPVHHCTEEEFELRLSDRQLVFEKLLNDETDNVINNLAIAKADKRVLENIHNKVLEIDTFDYDGVKYNTADASALIVFLDAEMIKYNDKLDQTDTSLFRFFLHKAIEQDKLQPYKTHYQSYQQSLKRMEIQQEAYRNLVLATQFMQTMTPFDQIIENTIQVKKMETPFCEQIKLILEDPFYQQYLDTEMRAKFETYIAKDWRYYGHKEYLNEELDILYTAMFNFTEVIFKVHIQLKRTLLEFQANLLELQKHVNKNILLNG